MSALRLLFDHQIFGIQRFGGISRVYIELMRELSQNPDCRIHWFRGVVGDGQEVPDFQNRLDGYAAYQDDQEAMLAFPAFAEGPFDIYHPTYYDFSLARVPKYTRLITMVYDMILEKHMGHLQRFRPVIEGKRRYIETADMIFTISESTKSDLVDMTRIDPERIKVVPLASRLDQVQRSELPEELNGITYLLYVGTRSKYKNFELLSRAFQHSRWLRDGFHVVCFGGSGDYLPEELAFFRKCGIQDQFHYFHGTDGLLRALYENAACLVFTSLHEGFGLPLLEALQLGCPVVCARHSSIPEVVGDAACHFDPHDPGSLAEGIIAALSNRNTLIQKGKAHAARFSWSRSAQILLDGYRSALAEAR